MDVVADIGEPALVYFLDQVLWLSQFLQTTVQLADVDNQPLPADIQKTNLNVHMIVLRQLLYLFHQPLGEGYLFFGNILLGGLEEIKMVFIRHDILDVSQ